MITNDNSWSLGLSFRSLAKEEANPNKSLDQFGPSIPIHPPGDPQSNHRRKNCVHLTRFLTALPSVMSCGFIASIRSIQSIQIRVHSCPFVVSLPPQPL